MALKIPLLTVKTFVYIASNTSGSVYAKRSRKGTCLDVRSRILRDSKIASSASLNLCCWNICISDVAFVIAQRKKCLIFTLCKLHCSTSNLFMSFVVNYTIIIWWNSSVCDIATVEGTHNSFKNFSQPLHSFKRELAIFNLSLKLCIGIVFNKVMALKDYY